MYMTKHEQEEFQFLRQFFESLDQQGKDGQPGVAEIRPDISQTFANDLPNLKGRLAHMLYRAKPGAASGAAVQRATKDGWRDGDALGTWDPALKDAGVRLGLPDWAWF